MRTFVMFSLLAALVHCQGDSSTSTDISVPPETTTDTKPPDGAVNTPDKKSEETPLVTPSPTRALRRLALDILGQLPQASEYAAIIAGDKTLAKFVDDYLQQEGAAKTLGARLVAAYGFDPLNPHGILNEFKDASDESLPSGFGTQQISDIQDELSHLFRRALQDDLSFDELWSEPTTILDTAHADFYSVVSVKSLWPDDDLGSYTYNDQRPVLGLLSTQGAYTTSSHKLSDSSRFHAKMLLEHFFCQNLSSKEIHLFKDFPAETTQTELNLARDNQSPCVGCHKNISELRQIVYGLGRNLSYDDWATAVTKTSPYEGTFSQAPYASEAEALNLIAFDSRLHSCFVEKNLEEYLQVSLDDAFSLGTLSQFFEIFQEKNLSLLQWYKYFFKQDTYQNGMNIRIDPTISVTAQGEPQTTWKSAQFNTRLLNRIQWSGIANEYISDTTNLNFDFHLNVASQIARFNKSKLAHSSYVAATRTAAEAIASGIANQELGGDLLAKDRALFSALADSQFYKANISTLKGQVIQLWLVFTGNLLNVDDSIVTELTELYKNALAGQTTDAAAVQAWKVVLMGIFLSPEFVSY